MREIFYKKMEPINVIIACLGVAAAVVLFATVCKYICSLSANISQNERGEDKKNPVEAGQIASQTQLHKGQGYQNNAVKDSAGISGFKLPVNETRLQSPPEFIVLHNKNAKQEEEQTAVTKTKTLKKTIQ